MPRFAELGVVANVQLTMAISSAYNQKLVEHAVGPERWATLHPLRSLVVTGAVVAAGSDWPDEPVNPLLGIGIAVTRRSDPRAKTPWHPEQRITLAEALRLYTIAGAVQAGSDSEAGSIAVGKRADFIVLAQNIFEMNVSGVHQIRGALDSFGGTHRLPRSIVVDHQAVIAMERGERRPATCP